MTDDIETLSERDEIETLLPWYVTGRLGAEDRGRVERWIGHDHEMRARLSLIEEELGETVAANEAVVLPRSLAPDGLMAAIAAEEARRPATIAARVWRTIEALFTAPTPHAVRWAGAAAAIALLVQAIAIGALVSRGPDGRTGGYETASGGVAAKTGRFALVTFAETASIGQIAQRLDADGMTIADGPKPGGMFLVRIGAADMTEAERDLRIAALAANVALVRVAVPANP